MAIDASMSLYQFMIAVRYDGAHTLTDKDGESTRFVPRLALAFGHDVSFALQSSAGHVLSHDSVDGEGSEAGVCV